MRVWLASEVWGPDVETTLGVYRTKEQAAEAALASWEGMKRISGRSLWVEEFDLDDHEFRPGPILIKKL